MCSQFILIFHKAQNSTLRHVDLIEVYRQMHMYQGHQETSHPAISAFKEQVLLHHSYAQWSRNDLFGSGAEAFVIVMKLQCNWRKRERDHCGTVL